MEVKSKVPMFLALGGGGDVITATAAAAACGGIVASAAWEKLSVDPLPGPRRPGELLHTIQKNGGITLATNSTAFPNGISTNQSALVKEFPNVPQIIIDPWSGAPGVSDQLRRIALAYGVGETVGIDVGGDALDGEPSPTLTSPLADALLLASMWLFDPTSKVLVYGMGLDGEIEESKLKKALSGWLKDGTILRTKLLSLDIIRRITALLDKGDLKSEVSSLLFRSYLGMEGYVLLRDGGLRVAVGQHSTIGYEFRADNLIRCINPLGLRLIDVQSLDEASVTLTSLGHRTELDDQVRITRSATDLLDEAVHIQERLTSVVGDLRGLPADKGISYVADRYLARRIPCSLPNLRDALAVQKEELGLDMLFPYIKIC